MTRLAAQEANPMTRTLTFAAALAVIVASGLVYGGWTQRWQKSAELEARAARLRDLPDKIGPWKGAPAELPPEALALAGAEGSWVRRFIDERTGTSVLVILLCGRSGPVSVHPPEACYGSAGYALEAPPVRYTPPGEAPAEFWSGKFKQPEAGGRELRLFWAWNGDGAWRAPDNPRWTFAHLPALYKLYVIRETGGAAGRPDDDPAADFLRRLLPEAARALGGA
jgi:hypothetical protein